MLILLVIFAALLVAGSLFPWSFQPGPDLVDAAWHVATSWNRAMQQASRHDVLINLVIYVPIGFTAYLWPNWQSKLARWLCPVVLGLGLSFSVETVQHYFPPRAPGILDVICNVMGTALGVIQAEIFRLVLESRHIEWRRRYSVHLSSALLLLAIWVAERAWPAHTFPLGIGTRLRALANPGPWAPQDSLAGALTWIMAGFLFTAITGPRAARWFLLALLPPVLFLVLISPGHTFTWSYLGGALVSVILFWLLPEQYRYAGAWLAATWLCWILLEGLRPFTPMATPHSFGWVPFREMLSTNWMHSIGVLLQKTWIYGAAFWLLTHTSLRHRASLVLVLTVLASIEMAQWWLPDRSAGVTDPAIALLAAALLTLVDYRFTRTGDPARQIPPEARAAVPLSNG